MILKKKRVLWNKGKRHTEEWKKEMSERNLGQRNPFFGKKHTKETILKLKQSHQGPKPWLQGKKLSEEHKKRLSEVRRQRISDGRIQVWNKGKKLDGPSWMKGKTHSEESKEKNRLAHLRKPAWNKGKKTGLIPWNKGLRGKLHHTEKAKSKIRERRAKQVFPIKDSLPELKIKEFLMQLNIAFIPHKFIRDIKHAYQCDILIPSMNLIIEVDGDYWHGNINNPRFNVLNASQIKTKEIDNLRAKELMEKGFKILRLWESDIEKKNIEDFNNR